MYQLINQRKKHLQTLFRNVAEKTHLHEAVIEKDFWVCLTLDYLFHHCKYKNTFTFKGGTSLSKCYGLIKRFSEDIDLILDWRILGYGMDEPWEGRSKSKQDAFNKEANKRAERFLSDKLLPLLKEDMSQILGQKADFSISADDPQTICFKYPHFFEDSSTVSGIRLEIGPLAAWTPSISKQITSYVAEKHPQIFSKPSTSILTVSAERSFWEKVTILHHEANRPDDSDMPNRYSRHYYDIYCIAHSDIKQSAYNNLSLLKKVTDFKIKFYPRSWAHYELATPGTLKLLPSKHHMDALRKDYAIMENMFFDKYPNFQELMQFTEELEKEINLLKN